MRASTSRSRISRVRPWNTAFARKLGRHRTPERTRGVYDRAIQGPLSAAASNPLPQARRAGRFLLLRRAVGARPIETPGVIWAPFYAEAPWEEARAVDDPATTEMPLAASARPSDRLQLPRRHLVTATVAFVIALVGVGAALFGILYAQNARSEIRALRAQVSGLATRVGGLDAQLARAAARNSELVNTRLTSLSSRVNRQLTSFASQVSTKLGSLDTEFSALSPRLAIAPGQATRARGIRARPGRRAPARGRALRSVPRRAQGRAGRLPRVARAGSPVFAARGPRR